ncbi:E3 SUMO-protein ligase NSE2-like [Drosophila ficusphila]|uniref:E3 SUMO-protein ligase NSE2-like n=1 Tax=Drosophila ficusphila TaxID=30025 RepID=UPI0007E5C884|nr:E3 SUMO-protein ligase NSE2-like [Drosophila ficusphila]
MDFNQHVDSVLNTLVENTNFIKEMSEAMAEYGDDENAIKLLEESAQSRIELAEHLIRMKSQYKAFDLAMQEAKAESATIEELEGSWKERRETVEKKRINVKNLGDFKSFKQAIESAAGRGENGQANGPDEDDDVIIEGVEETGGEIFSLLDPWSKAMMKNPVRNQICGHIYDRDSAMLIIKDNIGVRCPVLGCANKKYIQPAHLVEDAKLRQRLAEEAAAEADLSE